ncbi:hypothetical protein [Lacticaseibacillus parakribbianus]|uniref:hypothetical protein n=1 Tax=Lacticaseibacillus parakribbianus TaxID=2970927 RepID=UPI0021CB6B7F|nr:hypothetical protein [Lacticaseibacillus parakribbianus]
MPESNDKVSTNEPSQSVKQVNTKHIAILILSLLVTAVSLWYRSVSNSTANVVEGNIFVLKTEQNGEWTDTGYLVFGGKENGYGALFISKNSKSYVDDLNSSGQLADMLSYQSSNYNRFWDIESNAKNLKWTNGLSEDSNPDDATFQDTSMEVSKISGIFTKKLTGVFHDTTFDFQPETVNAVLVKYSKIKN